MSRIGDGHVERSAGDLAFFWNWGNVPLHFENPFQRVPMSANRQWHRFYTKRLGEWSEDRVRHHHNDLSMMEAPRIHLFFEWLVNYHNGARAMAILTFFHASKHGHVPTKLGKAGECHGHKMALDLVRGWVAPRCCESTEETDTPCWGAMLSCRHFLTTN